MPRATDAAAWWGEGRERCLGRCRGGSHRVRSATLATLTVCWIVLCCRLGASAGVLLSGRDAHAEREEEEGDPLHRGAPLSEHQPREHTHRDDLEARPELEGRRVEQREREEDEVILYDEEGGGHGEDVSVV